MNSDRICDLLTTFSQECITEEYGLPFETMRRIETQLVDALPAVLTLTERESRKIRDAVDLQLAVLLSRFSRRMANAAVTLSDEALVRIALVAISLDQDLLDERDLYRTGALILDCCGRIGCTPEVLYSDCLTAASENRKALLVRQLQTAPGYMRSLRAMKFSVVQSESQFKYVDQMFESPLIDNRVVNKVIAELGKEGQ